MYVRTYVRTYICMYIHTYSHTYGCTYVCIYIHILIYVYIYIYIHMLLYKYAVRQEQRCRIHPKTAVDVQGQGVAVALSKILGEDLAMTGSKR